MAKKNSDSTNALNKERAVRKSLQRKLKGLRKKKGKAPSKMQRLEKQVASMTRSSEDRKLRKSLGKVFKAEGIHPAALEDVLVSALKGKEKFILGADGSPVRVDGSGDPIFSKKGKEISPRSYIKSMKKEKPHLFTQATGSGVEVARVEHPRTGRNSPNGPVRRKRLTAMNTATTNFSNSSHRREAEN